MKASRTSAELGVLLEDTKRDRKMAASPEMNRRLKQKPASSSTLRRVVKAMAPEVAVAGTSTDARKVALADLYNPIAFAAILHHTREVDPRLLLSMDGLHVYLGDKLGAKSKL